MSVRLIVHTDQPNMTARDIVTNRIAEQARRFPDLLLASLDVSTLDQRDAALAQAIEHAVVRRWLTLVTVLEAQLSRPWAELEAKLQAVLLVGAAQLLLLERIPDHAVINESVEWAKRRIRPKAGGLVNAVLRKVAGLRQEVVVNTWAADELPLHDGRAWKLNQPIFDAQPFRRAAQQSSHSQPLMSHWLTTYGESVAIELARHSLVHAPIIVHGIGADQPHAMLQPHDEPGFHVFTGDRAQLHDLLHHAPGTIVQDPTSAAPVRASASLLPPPRLIIDACAGRGTKTRQLASVHAQARVVASDVDEARFETLQRQFADQPRVQVVSYRALKQFAGQADLLLLDVPCSNTGVLARRVEAKYRFTSQAAQKLGNLQRQIVADTLTLLSPTGRILYSTCSIDPAENQQQAKWISAWHAFGIVEDQTQLPVGRPGDPLTMYRDGGYFAVLERTKAT